MSTEVIDSGDRILTFRVTGQFKHSDMRSAQQAAAGVIKQRGKVRFLVLMEDITGVDQAGDWGDISFQAENDPYIEKMAIVGDRKWEDVTVLFTGKGIRRVPIEYFSPAELPKAKEWLES